MPRLFMLAVALVLTSCSTTPNPDLYVEQSALLPPTSRSFLLKAPFDTKLNEAKPELTSLLPPGRYTSLYRDGSGEYFEAPFTPRKEYLFGNGTRGGVFISKDSKEARLFIQDLETSTYIALAGSVAYTVVVAPSGTVLRSNPFPADFFNHITFSSNS